MNYWILAIMLVILLAVFLYLENTLLSDTRYEISSPRIPDGFDGFSIVLLSDIHNTLNPLLKRGIVNRIMNLKPDIIVIAGDLLDSRRTNIDAAITLIRQLTPQAPVYYVVGNHESRIQSDYAILKEQLMQEGVNVMHNCRLSIFRNGSEINIIGLEDPFFQHIYDREQRSRYLTSNYLKLADAEKYNLVLVHRPEYLDDYAATGMDLVMCGHAHGGQVRLPWIGGLFAPGQGILPDLTSGVHMKKNTQMVISRGLGNSLAPFRIFNHPETVFITLKTKR